MTEAPIGLPAVGAADRIKYAQIAWANSHDIQLQKGNPRSSGPSLYTLSLEDNLYEPMCDEAVADFRDGDGSPLKGKNDCLPHLWALHNSDALAVNVFHYWKLRSPAAIARCIGIPPRGIRAIHFEKKFRVLRRGTRPNIDVAIEYEPGSAVRWVGIEAKMVESYPSKRRKLLDDKYFADDGDWWEELPATRRLAESFRGSSKKTEPVHRHLDRGQLIKHLLGLRKAAHEAGQRRDRVTLVYLWFDDGSTEADCHRQEIGQFTYVLVADGVSFIAMSWQEVIEALRQREHKAHSPYVQYLADRYLPRTIETGG